MRCPRDPVCGAEDVAVTECCGCDRSWCSECKDEVDAQRPPGTNACSSCAGVAAVPTCSECKKTGPGKYHVSGGLAQPQTVWCDECFRLYVAELERQWNAREHGC